MTKYTSILYPCISLLIGGTTLYLFKIYGSLVWWWVQLERGGVFGGKKPPATFFGFAEQIHILVIIFAALNLCLAIMLWRTKLAQAMMGVLAVVFAACVLLVCLLVSV